MSLSSFVSCQQNCAVLCSLSRQAVSCMCRISQTKPIWWSRCQGGRTCAEYGKEWNMELSIYLLPDKLLKTEKPVLVYCTAQTWNNVNQWIILKNTKKLAEKIPLGQRLESSYARQRFYQNNNANGSNYPVPRSVEAVDTAVAQAGCQTTWIPIAPFSEHWWVDEDVQYWLWVSSDDHQQLSLCCLVDQRSTHRRKPIIIL